MNITEHISTNLFLKSHHELISSVVITSATGLTFQKEICTTVNKWSGLLNWALKASTFSGGSYFGVPNCRHPPYGTISRQKNKLYFHFAPSIAKSSRNFLELGHQHGDTKHHYVFKKILARKTKIKFGWSDPMMGAQCIASHAMIHLKGFCLVCRCIQQGIKDSTGILVLL